MKALLLSLSLLALALPLAADPAVIPAAKTVSSIPLLALEGQSFAGLTLATPLFDDHPLALAELIAGKSQALLTGSSLAIKNNQSGGPLIHLATTVWDVSGLVTLNPELKTLKDFVGRKLVVPLAGGPLDLQLQAILKAQGLQGQVQIDYAEPAQAVAMLLQKKVDGACLPEPLVSRVVLLNQATELFTFAQAWAPLNQNDGRAPQVSLLARRDWAAAHVDFVRAFLAAYRASVLAVRADPAGYAARFAPVLGLPAPLVERGLRQTLWSTPTWAETSALFQRYLTLIGETKPLSADFFFPD